MNIENLKEQLANVLSSNINLQGKIDQATQLLENAGVPQESINQAQEVIANNGGIEQVLSTIQNTGGGGEMLGGFATDMTIEQATGGFMDQIGSFFGGEGGQDGEEVLNKIIINQNALTNNFNKFRRIIPRNKKIISVVKANAYGHGLKEIVALIKNDTDYFQVDDIEELRILRNISDKPTLVLGYVQKSDLEELVSLNGILGLYSISQAQELNKTGQILNKLIKIHICIDSHLGRDGILASEIEKALIELKGMQFIQVEGYYSHFANIEDTTDRSHAEKQISTFDQVKVVIRSYFPHSYSHISATSGILEYEQISKSNSFVRLGIGLYGIWPSEELRKKHSDNLQLIPVLSLKSKLAQIKILPKNHTVGYGLTFKTIKDMKVGVVPIGYSDGVDRNLSNTGEVLVRGQRCRIIGRISMNMLTIDLSKVTNVEVEDEVILIGKQQNEEITAEEIAHKIGTINYEVLARLSPLLQKTLDFNIHE